MQQGLAILDRLEIVIDPDDASRIVVITSIAVYLSTDTGATWSDITGDVFAEGATGGCGERLGDAGALGTRAGRPAISRAEAHPPDARTRPRRSDSAVWGHAGALC